MEWLWIQLREYMVRSQSLTLQERLYRLTCLLVASFCLLVILPANLAIGLPLFVNVADIILALFAGYCYREANRGRNYFTAFFLGLIALMDLAWFPNAGSQGSVTFYFFLSVLLPTTLSRGWARRLLVLALVLNVCALLLLEHRFPWLVTPFQSPLDRLIDLISGAICGMVFGAVLIAVVIAIYDWEHDSLLRVSRNLAASERNYREVVENAQIVILRLDRSGRVTLFNQQAERVFDCPRQEVQGRDAARVLWPHLPEGGEEARRALANWMGDFGSEPRHENEYQSRGGRRIWLSWIIQPIRDEQQRLVEILCLGDDITERKAIWEQLLLTQQTMDAAAELILWTDEHGCIIYANTAVSLALGYTQPELRRMRIPDIAVDFTEADWPPHWAELKRRTSLTFEAAQRRKDGTQYPVDITVNYMRVGQREFSVAFVRDISERKQAEAKREQLEQHQRNLQKIESLGLLAGGIAHDFNNLLAAILGNISLARAGLEEIAPERELLTEAEKAARQARDLTVQLLTFSRGGQPIKGAVALEQVIRDSANLALRGSSSQFQPRLAPDLWPVEADPAQLSQVFNNLFINANQAMPMGGQVSVTATNRTISATDNAPVSAGDYAEVVVKDHGVGISEEHLPRIFDPYFTTKKTGSGLGLAVVFSILKHHGGHISVISKAGEGTAFTLLLPASVRPMNTSSAATVPLRRGSGRILVMDDEAMLRKALAKMLEFLGYEPVCASEGESAVAIYQEALSAGRPFDVVILDLTVPGGMGGKEAIALLRQINPRLRAIVSSGYSNDPIMADHRAHGFCAVMSKPYSVETLEDALRQALVDNPSPPQETSTNPS